MKIERNTKMMNSYEMMKIKMGGVEVKREAILKNARIIMDSAIESGFSFAPTCRLYEVINCIMGWTDTIRCKQTVENMASKGIITISKSGKGFKLNK